ncbi:polysaccharide biosynthesis/export family protein [Robiginitalea sp. IMCC43444]|uniref:polysaccharide biosynthesis/export family protein n=1 Tax=Robiginitalea sp. IMCC43444 TaxID=3459121 RepID=UPI0040415C30
MKIRMFKSKPFIVNVIGSIIIMSFISCGSVKDVIYLQDAGEYESIITDNTFSPKFKIDDVISIYISTLNSEASAPFNLTAGGGQQIQTVDYIVDRDGNIDFPVLGKLKVAGLSPEELRILLRHRLADFLKDPIINIRLRNFGITILGAVSNPGTYMINGEQVSILEAISLAGDLLITGKRDNIMVIREFENTKVYHRIDITSKDIFSSPVFYLTQNDVVYVEPNRNMASQAFAMDSRVASAITILSFLLTLTTVILVTN